MWLGIIIGLVAGAFGLFAALYWYGRHVEKKMTAVELVAEHVQLYLYLFENESQLEIWDFSRQESDNIVGLQMGLTRSEIPIVSAALPIFYVLPSVNVYYCPGTQEFDFEVEVNL